jgi:ribonuclease VapC
MIIDASAILAVVLGEPDAERYLDALLDAPRCRLLAPNWLEAAMTIDSRGDLETGRRFDELFAAAHIEITPFTPEHARIARRAFQRFGKTRHPAKLNFGDCMAYAFAASAREPLLFKGPGFARTDVIPALSD